MMRVPFSYLDRQFAEAGPYLQDIEVLVRSGDFTLGPALEKFERRFAALCGAPHAIGVASGTDALILSLKALGIGPGDEVITTPLTFISTVEAIAWVGAKPVFVDSEEGFVLDSSKIERAVTPRTKAILPVHYAGNVADMPAILKAAGRHGLRVIEDGCQAIGASLGGRPVGSWGEAAAFSLHPLKNLNVWGDGGVVTTRDGELAQKLKFLRNHGLAHRDEAVLFGTNSRLDTLQAVVANRLMDQLDRITARRIEIAGKLDRALAGLAPWVRVPPRKPGIRHVFHLYMIRVERRDELLGFLRERGVEAKVHYPLPVHLHKAAEPLGYRRGDFPVAESDCACILSLPAHPYLTDEEVGYMVEQVALFYKRPVSRPTAL